MSCETVDGTDLAQIAQTTMANWQLKSSPNFEGNKKNSDTL
jgi:hypothetical protein